MFATTIRLLTFRLDRAGYAALGRREAALGLAFAWLAGIGRYWDHPTAGPAQKSGVGSVVYVLALAGLIWLILRPLPWNRRPYLQVVAAVGLTAPLAWLYAIPVEKWLDVDGALRVNLWFLLIVAAWRVLLYGRFLRVGARCARVATLVIALLPLAAIVTSLAILDLERSALDLMAGIDRSEPSRAVAQQTELILMDLTLTSFYAVLPLLISYAAIVWAQRSAFREAHSDRSS